MRFTFLVSSFLVLCFLSCKEVATQYEPLVKDGMAWIPSGTYQMGSENSQSRRD